MVAAALRSGTCLGGERRGRQGIPGEHGHLACNCMWKRGTMVAAALHLGTCLRCEGRGQQGMWHANTAERGGSRIAVALHAPCNPRPATPALQPPPWPLPLLTSACRTPAASALRTDTLLLDAHTLP